MTISSHSIGRLAGIARRSMPLFVLAYTMLCLCELSFAAEPIFSRTNKFKIPFQFDEKELEKLGATDIQLHVSTNQGASWRLHHAVSPDSGKFVYEAAEDGEYWFSVRTLAAGGISYPAGPHEPGLKVIVDTVPPELGLELTETESGQIELRWLAADKHLTADSLALEFLEPALQVWKKVEVRPTAQGRTSWTVEKAGLVEVRGFVRDEAGNIREVATQTIVAGVDPSLNQLRPIADADSGPKMVSNQPLESGMNSLAQLIAESKSEKPSSQLFLPAELSTAKTQAETKTVSESAELDVTNKEPATSSAMDSKTAATATPAEPNVTETAPENALQTTAQPDRLPDRAPQASLPAEAVKTLTEPPRTKQAGHFVNSLTFQISYEVEGAGPSGVSKIDLYITEDGGTQWFHYGNDADLTSPFVVTVPREGDYGFSFRIQNGAGMRATPPQPGDRPEIQVTVDQAPPVVELLPVKAIAAPAGHQLKIEWTVEDRQLAAAPIALYHALEPNGPWKLIDGWVANSASYIWMPTQSLNGPVYLRLDVRDAAGNLTRQESPQPLIIDHAQPKARITEVEPVDASIAK